MFLRCFGFGAKGPVAGGMAARRMARIGKTSAGVMKKSWFATCQSIAMGGAVPA
ncbi:hypothetical protein V8C86DRAFT_2527743 [Haematococcus lacustris]